jgi:hypothetical protein
VGIDWQIGSDSAASAEIGTDTDAGWGDVDAAALAEGSMVADESMVADAGATPGPEFVAGIDAASEAGSVSDAIAVAASGHHSAPEADADGIAPGATPPEPYLMSPKADARGSVGTEVAPSREFEAATGSMVADPETTAAADTDTASLADLAAASPDDPAGSRHALNGINGVAPPAAPLPSAAP